MKDDFPQEILLENERLQARFRDGYPVEMRDTTTGASWAGAPPAEGFMVAVRETVTAETTTSYGVPGCQARKRQPGKDARNPLAGVPHRLRSMERAGEGVRARFQAGAWEFALTYTLERAALRVHFELSYAGEGAPWLSESGFALPALRAAAVPLQEQRLALYDLRNHTCELDTPLSEPVRPQEPFDHLPVLPHRLGAMDCDAHHEVDFLLSHGRHRLFGWSHEEEGQAVSYVYSKGASGLQFSPCFWSFEHILSSNWLSIGDFYLNFFDAEEAGLAASVAEIKRGLGWTSPPLPEGLSAGCILQKHGFIADGGGLEAEIAELETFRRLGVTVLYLPPLYPPEAYLNDLRQPLMPCAGTLESLRRYTDAAHRLGMRVIVDMIAHNLFRGSKLIQEHPEFLRRDELGEPLGHFIGGAQTETTSPAFQEFYEGICLRMAEEGGVDGFRFDVAGFQLPGWRAPLPPRRTVVAQAALLRRLHARLSRIRPMVFLEEGMGVCGLRYVSHGYIPYVRFLKEPDEARLPEVLSRLEKLTRYRFLKDRPDELTMLHLKIHDTALLSRFGRHVQDGDLALLRYTLLAEGIPLITDTLERGVYDEIRRLLALRRALPELGGGTTSFALTRDNPRVFAFLRTEGRGRTLVCVNFSRQPQSVRVTLEEAAACHESLFVSEGSAVRAPFVYDLAENGCIAVKVEGRAPASVAKEDVESHNLFAINELQCRRYLVPRPLPEVVSPNAAQTFDEGSFSQHEANAAADCVAAGDSAWFAADYDDSSWRPPFRPSTRQPYLDSRLDNPAPYMEDIAEWEHNALWMRPASMKHGEARFRARFTLPSRPERASLVFYSPALYDFEVLLEADGDVARMSGRLNAVQAWVNGVPLGAASVRRPEERLDLPTSLFHDGENTLAFCAAYGNGGHGGCCRLVVDGRDVPLDFRTAPPVEVPLEGVALAQGKETVLRKPAGAIGFQVLEFALPAEAVCRLEGEGRAFTVRHGESPRRVNSYSGAELPVLRSDEFFPRESLWTLRAGGLALEALTPSTVLMLFQTEGGWRVCVCTEEPECRLRV